MAKKSKAALAEYQAKRDFTISPEPTGAGTRSSGRPLFCVQKHLARSLHYDLRLEHDGVLLSWAVPKGPSLNPKDKRFAARTEDHPLDYGDFEGVIPEGYGAGIVMLWDQGTWASESGDIGQAVADGELKFRLDGVKLKGSWVLVRTRGSRDNKEQWLLIKHKDRWAGDLDVTTFTPHSVKSFGDFSDILRAKTIPPAWRKRLPIQSGDTATLLREIIGAADKPGSSDSALPRLPACVLQFGEKRPKLTNQDKVLYPDGFTKGQVIEYYMRVAPLILPHLAGRAVTLKRYPDGIDGKAFFHKRCPAHRPEWVQTVRVMNDEGEAIDYCRIEDISTLVWVANLAAIELHVPLALAAAPDSPTAMVFDLDPGEPAGVRECIEVARRITALLDQMKLASAVKFSGKKGVHLLVPLDSATTTFGETRLFAKALAETLTRDDPKRVTSVMRKEDRKGKVYIDWNQNDRSRTMVCAYSLRAEASPKISWPMDLNAPLASVPLAYDVSAPSSDPLRVLLSCRQRLPRWQ